MLKKKIAVVLAAAMLTLSAGSAFAYTADNELFRVIYSTDSTATKVIVNDLGSISSILATTGSNAIAGTAFSYSTLGSGANASNTYEVFFAKNNKTTGTTTYDVYMASDAAPTSGNRKFAGFNSSVINWAALYTDANTTGLVTDYQNKFGAFGNGMSFVDTTIAGSHNEIQLASAATLNLYKFSSTANTLFPVTTGTALPNITITTNAATGVTTISGANPNPVVPIPAAFYLMGSGLMGLIGLRRRKNA